MARGSLPPGFRFHPTDIELVMYYLKRKIMVKKLHLEAIAELNIYKFSPWDLPDKSCLKAKDLEWYFFCPRERKYASGARMNRATETGYWKTTGKDRAISYNDRVVGMVKTLVFHECTAPHGKRTDWVIHEYRLDDKRLADAGVVQDSFVLCKVFQKSGPGPKNGAHYGAPFNEEEWNDDDSVTSTLPSYPMSQVGHALPEFQHCFAATSTSMAVPGMGGRPLLNETAESKIQSSCNNVHPNGHNYSVADMFDPGNASSWSLTDVSVTPYANNEFTDDADAIAHLLSALSEDCDIQELDNVDGGGNTEPALQVAGCGSLNGLHAVHNLSLRIEAPANQFGCNQSNLLSQDDITFFKLDDLHAPVSPVASIGSQLFLDDLHEPCTPFGSEQNLFSCMSNSDNTYSRIGQSFCNGPFFGPQPSSPILSDLPVLSNSSDGLVDSHIFTQTATGYGNNFHQGLSSSNHFHPTFDRQPGNGGAREIQERGVNKRKYSSFVHPPSLVEHPSPPTYSAHGGSSQNVKAEVTWRSRKCTEDALSVKLGESTCICSFWLNFFSPESPKKGANWRNRYDVNDLHDSSLVSTSMQMMQLFTTMILYFCKCVCTLMCQAVACFSGLSNYVKLYIFLMASLLKSSLALLSMLSLLRMLYLA